eukprot:364552-Chlamydomonas_euryale.AAC.8
MIDATRQPGSAKGPSITGSPSHTDKSGVGSPAVQRRPPERATQPSSHVGKGRPANQPHPHRKGPPSHPATQERDTEA